MPVYHMPEDLILQASSFLPAVKLRANGNFDFRGRFMHDHLFSFFKPIHAWVSEIEVSNIRIEFDLEYLPTNALDGIRELLRILNDNEKVKEISVHWHYDLDDEEMHDKGMVLQERFTTVKFQFVGREATEDYNLLMN